MRTELEIIKGDVMDDVLRGFLSVMAVWGCYDASMRIGIKLLKRNGRCIEVRLITVRGVTNSWCKGGATGSGDSQMLTETLNGIADIYSKVKIKLPELNNERGNK